MSNVRYCSEVKQPGDWAFFTSNGVRHIKAMLPIEPVVVPFESCDQRIIALPVEGPGGWTWNNDENAPTLEPSIKTEIVIGHTEDTPPKPIMREIYHGHLTAGNWHP